MADRKDKGPRPASRVHRSDEDRRELVLCVGQPPALRDLLALGLFCRVVVIRDLARAWRFLAARRVSRVLLDLSILSRGLTPAPVPVREEGNGSRSLAP